MVVGFVHERGQLDAKLRHTESGHVDPLIVGRRHEHIVRDVDIHLHASMG